MKKNNEKKNKTMRLFVIAVAMCLFVTGFITGFISELTVIEELPLDEAVEKVKKWNLVSATNITAVNTDTMIINYLTYPHQSSPYTLYDDALDEANAYEHLDDTPACSSEELEHTTPHSTLFDVIVIIQWGYAEAYNTSSASWDKGLVQVYINITSTDTELNSVSSEVMLEGDFYDIDGTNDAMMNCYVVGTGGFDLGQDVKFTINDVKLYYWG